MYSVSIKFYFVEAVIMYKRGSLKTGFVDVRKDLSTSERCLISAM